MEDLIKREDAIKEVEGWFKIIELNPDILIDNINTLPAVEPNLILPEKMERGECYEVGETIVVMNHDDYYDMLTAEPKQGEWFIGRYCSVCGWDKADADWTKGWSENFCPNCGADMRGDDNEKQSKK